MFHSLWLTLCQYQPSKWTCTWSGQFKPSRWKIGRKVIGSIGASVKQTCLKVLRTVLLNELCWIVTKIGGKCKHKKINMSMPLKHVFS